ncbi:MAG: putative CRISPR-associated protein [Nitrososphaerales archaeon]
MSYVHIVTVGASLASNYERDRAGDRVRDAEINEKLSKMHEAELARYIKELTNFIQKKEGEGKLSEVSAEINALSRFLKEISLVYLIHSDTNIGRCCARALRDYLSHKGIQVSEPIEVYGLHEAKTFQKGLANLIRETAKILSQYKNFKYVRVCATGGFKPEAAIASILGFVAGKSIYYIHESFREEVHLPPLPLSWKLDVKKYGKAIDALLKAEEIGIPKDSFIKDFGHETYDFFIQNWLIDEYNGNCKVTEVTSAILEAIRLLS